MSVADWMTTDLYRGVLAFEEQYPSLDEQAVARRFVNAMSGDQRKAALVDAVLGIVRSHRTARDRARARQIEAEATLEARRAEYEARRAEYEADAFERRRQWAENPRYAPRNTKVFRAWAATEEGMRLLAEEADRKRQRAEEEAEENRLFDEDPDEWMRRYSFGAQFTRLLDEYRTTVRLELTEELLGSSFAVGDGRTVTWSEATVRDHQERIQMLARQLEGGARTMTLHEKAVEMLMAANQPTLGALALRAA